jgi:hypothetical protein
MTMVASHWNQKHGKFNRINSGGSGDKLLVYQRCMLCDAWTAVASFGPTASIAAAKGNLGDGFLFSGTRVRSRKSVFSID